VRLCKDAKQPDDYMGDNFPHFERHPITSSRARATRDRWNEAEVPKGAEELRSSPREETASFVAGLPASGMTDVLTRSRGYRTVFRQSDKRSEDLRFSALGRLKWDSCFFVGRPWPRWDCC
jgi:hypothetical protein